MERKPITVMSFWLKKKMCLNLGEMVEENFHYGPSLKNWSPEFKCQEFSKQLESLDIWPTIYQN